MSDGKARIPFLESEVVHDILIGGGTTKDKAKAIKLYADDIKAHSTDGPFRRENIDRIERLVEAWELEQEE